MNSSQSEGNDRPDPVRRRLARGGLAGTVVLGSLISRPVLGNGVVGAPYDCTISGQLSGNMSPRAGDGIACNSLGQSPSTWATITDWPFGVTRGSLPTATTTPFPHPFADPGTYFNGFLGLANSFRYNEAGGIGFNTTNATRPATILQILLSPNTNDRFNFGREAIAALLNAIGGGVGAAPYPLTPPQVVAMYNAVYNGGSYLVNASVSWDRRQVFSYFRSLRAGV